ncbi:MAG: hypothetical protein JW862_08970 [Anaerolineales bacterium]|nr:hypothetical protein [Anaerolineales bacterium]
MIRKKSYDGVVETVRYSPEGKIRWVRAYERHGFVFTDHFLMDRETLLERLKAGKRFYTGERQVYMGSDFTIKTPLRLVQQAGQDYIVAGDANGEQDRLEGVPII